MTSPRRLRIIHTPLLFASFAIFAAVLSQQMGRPASAQTEDNAATAKEILDKVSKTYGNCKTYRDSGTVKRISKTGSKLEYEDTFETLFVRPDRFRFDWRHSSLFPRKREIMRAIIWRKGDDWRSEEEVPPDLRAGAGRPVVIPRDPPTKAIAQIVAYGSFTAHSVPLLLLSKQIDGFSRITEMTDLKRLEDDKLDKTGCFRIRGQEAENNLPTTVWIDKKTFLIRRIDRTWKGKFWIEATTTYNPEIDVKIPDEMLEFKRKEKEPK